MNQFNILDLATNVPIKYNKKFDLNEIKKLNYTIITNKVYSLENFAEIHPGGKKIILLSMGKDSTDEFLAFHPIEKIKGLLSLYQVGYTEFKSTSLQDDFYQMISKMYDENLFTNTLSNVLKDWSFAVMFLIISLYLKDINIYMAGISLGLFWQQLAFMGHDYSHSSVEYNRFKDSIGSFFITLSFGVSGVWWKYSHNIHHIFTNSIENDPDIQYLPLFAISPDMIKNGGFFSNFHRKFFPVDTISKYLVKVQHLTYYPVMMIARYNIYLESIKIFFNKDINLKERLIDLLGLIGYWMLYGYLLTLINSEDRLVYHMISHSVIGILHLQITLSHFSMPTHKEEESECFIKTQFNTTMNIKSERWMDWFHGGLQFQIEHHLIPRMTRRNLRYIKQKYIKDFAKRNNLPYKEYGFIDAVKDIYSSLKRVTNFINPFLGFYR